MHCHPETAASPTAPAANESQDTFSHYRKKRDEQSAERVRMAMLTSFCLAGLVVGWMLEIAEVGSRWAILSAYFVSYISGGYFSSRRAFAELLRGSINVDLLMVLAALGAATVGELPEGAILLFLFSLSGTLEQFVLGKTRSAIEALMDIAPDEATISRSGQHVRVPIGELQIGETVFVSPGERIPADGIIRRGTTTVDESAMTGESMPANRGVGDNVLAGTVNQFGAIEIEVTREASNTTLARIIKRVEEAQSEKASSEVFTDWFGKYYTIAVLVGATSAVAVYYAFVGLSFSAAFYKAMTILVVASPCAVVISIPAAILSAVAAGARSGVLFKGGIHLERTANLKAIAFDKTGTLSVGRPRVAAIIPAEEISEEECLQLAASAEALSEHPLARAVVEEARARQLNFLPSGDLQAIVGRGVSARVSSQLAFVGKPELFEEHGIPIAESIKKSARILAEQGSSVIYIGTQSRLYGIIALADQLRASAKPAIEELRALGIRNMVMLTGDNPLVGQRVASQLGIEVKAGLMPEDKVDYIEQLRKDGTITAMVGDGINDAPSLAAADVGFALGGSSTAVALETADVVLVGADLVKLPYAVSLGRRAQTIIRQNLCFAFGVMLVLLSITLFSTLRLPFAVAGHEGSTVLVILNGLRLLGAKPS